jgi:hypothetical protein
MKRWQRDQVKRSVKSERTRHSTPPGSRIAVRPLRSRGNANDVVAGATFVGRDPDRNIRFHILRDISRL